MEDHAALLEEGFPPAGKTPCSVGELHHSEDATHKQGRDVESLEIEVDISGSTSSGTKRGKGDDGNSHNALEDSESKEPSTYERAVSLPPMPRLISAMKGGREKSGEALLAENRRVKWDPDVYDPPVTSVDHSVKSDQQQRPRSKKKDKNQQKQKHKRKSRSGNRGAKKSGHDGVRNPCALVIAA
ncbi:uncharacterized protein LOC100841417 isoform X2 [Brachypodium distachyon]|uniref:Uncharacterized protein n=2 Tax=Brachypodium distachyon TaxID=15368 RepID=A0A2K2DHC7_BRADI|nr:uncharacterized protein LOC100841417 isoform X2 [Brachypodium distachyon]PNT73688.1 hypothetical protein BRADI_2g62434v3 [Brachypodium distachyon]|eukprot:XP_014754996.1 uncharacterized protein LOC100841417 isoform X2 [Brachypodium distachyon]